MTLLDENGQPVNRAFFAKRITDRGIDEMLGLCKGIIADGKVDQKEAEFILNWLKANKEAASQWPCNIIAARAAEYLQDGVLDQEEAQDLLELMSQITGENNEICTSVNKSIKFFDDFLPHINFDGTAFCLTGKFALGSRKECEKEIINLGGKIKKSISKKLDYLIIGSIGSEAWIHSNFGRKIENAWELKHSGHQLYIVPEDHWANCLI